MKRQWIVIPIVILVIVSCVLITRSPYYIQHYGYGFSDRIRIFCYVDGSILRTSEYSVSAVDDNTVKQKTYAYTSKGKYGTFWYKLNWNGKEVKFYLENANDWWRTDLSIEITDGGETVKQTNYIFNNDPPITEVYSLTWDNP